MLKHTLIVLSLAGALLLAVEPLQSVQGILMTEAEVSMLNAGGTTATVNVKPEGRGNAFLRVLKAPFKAIGRLFRFGKKDDNKLHRLSEKDVKRFESIPVTQVKDATSVVPSSSADQGGNTDDSAAGHVEKGRALLNAGQLNEAIAELSLAAAIDPKLAEAHDLLGVAYERKGLREKALKSFETAVHAKNDEPMHLNNLGYLLYKQGDYDGAVKYLKRAAKLAPNDERIWNNLGLAQCELGKFDDAYKSFAQAGGEFNGRINIATRLDRKGFTKKALEHLEKARALKPNSTEVLSSLAVMYEETGQYAAADKVLASLSTLLSTASASNPQEK